MIQKLEATVENGTLKVSTPLHGLSNGQRVRILVAPVIERSDFEGLSEEKREELFLELMEQQSVFDNLEAPSGPPVVSDFEPLPAGGPSLSEMIIEDRR